MNEKPIRPGKPHPRRRNFFHKRGGRGGRAAMFPFESLNTETGKTQEAKK